MRVRFLKDGRFGHAEPGRGAFDCVKGETMSGISETTAGDLKKAKWAEILGADDEEESTDGDKEESKSDENTDGKTGTSGKPDDNGGKKPWATS